MGGSAVFAGATFQQKVIAFCYVYILGQVRLSWIGDRDDTPLSIEGETGGAGDDVGVRFGDRCPPMEIQAKHGLKSGETLVEAVRGIATRRTVGDKTEVFIAVNAGVSGALRNDVPGDLDRLRSGRTDGLKADVRTLKETFASDPTLLQILHLIALDLDEESGSHVQSALQRLEAILEDPQQKFSAWDALLTDAGKLCADKRAHSRPSLLAMLKAKNIALRPLRPEVHRQLDASRDLLNAYQTNGASLLLARVERDIEAAGKSDPEILYRVYCQRATVGIHEDLLSVALDWARKAIDLDPDRVDALILAANVSATLGDFPTAKRYLERAKKSTPGDPRVWGLSTYVLCLEGGQPPDPPPPDVADADDYLVGCAEGARVHGDWKTVEATSRAILRNGTRRPDVLVLLAHSIVSTLSARERKDEDLAEVERLSTEVIDGTLIPPDPRLRQALMLRAGAHLQQGRKGKADDDLNRLAEWSKTSPEVLNNLAYRRLQEHDPRGGIAILSHGSVASDPALLFLRASAHLLVGEKDAALQDFKSANALIGANATSALLGAQAEMAFQIGDSAMAETLVANLGERGDNVVSVAVTRGRLAIAKKDVDQGVEWFRRASALQPEEKQSILLELAGRLLRADLAKDALPIFEEAGAPELPDWGLRDYAMVLRAIGKLEDAKTLVDRLAKKGALPDWALNMAIELAYASDDSESAIEYLRSAISRTGPYIGEARVAMARLLIDAGKPTEALTEARAALSAQGLTPTDRMNAAQVLAYLGEEEEALACALYAYRLDPNDEEMNKGLIQVSHMARKAPAKVEVVARDTYVTLVAAGKEPLSYGIYESPPVDARSGELLVEEATKLGLLGKRVGETLTWSPGTWREATWTISEITGAVVHVVNDVYANYETRFPGQTFIFGFPVPDGAAIGDLLPVISTLEANRKQRENAFRVYRTSLFPLGWVASVLRDDMSDVMSQLSYGSDESTILAAESSDPAEQVQAIRSVQGASELVLTRSALEIAERLELRDVVRDTYGLIVPRTLLRHLSQEAYEARRAVEMGRTSFVGGPAGVSVAHLDPGDERLRQLASAAESRLEWCRERCAIGVRPLGLVGMKTAAGQDLRNLIGADSWDALEISIDRQVPVWADDFGLRGVDVGGRIASVASSFAVLTSLAEKGGIDETRYFALVHRLLGQRYATILPSPKLLVSAVKAFVDLDRNTLNRIFATLSVVGNVSITAAMVAEMFRELATMAVQPLSVSAATMLALEGMSIRWPRRLAAKAVSDAALRRLALLPHDLELVQRTCIEFARADAPRPA